MTHHEQCYCRLECKLHFAADDLLAALEQIRDRLDAGLQDEDLDPEAFATTVLPALADVARAALTKAGTP